MGQIYEDLPYTNVSMHKTILDIIHYRAQRWLSYVGSYDREIATHTGPTVQCITKMDVFLLLAHRRNRISGTMNPADVKNPVAACSGQERSLVLFSTTEYMKGRFLQIGNKAGLKSTHM